MAKTSPFDRLRTMLGGTRAEAEGQDSTPEASSAADLASAEDPDKHARAADQWLASWVSRPNDAPSRIRSSGLSSWDREWMAFTIYFCLILVVDRLTNVYPPIALYGSQIYVMTLLLLSCWAGARAGLAICALVLFYVWLIFRFYPISAAVHDPRFMRQALTGVAIYFPIYALTGGVVHFFLGRAIKRMHEASDFAEREAKQRRRAEAELWASEEMRRLIVDSSVDAVVGVGTDGRINLWSPNAEKLFGWSRQEAIGQTIESRVCTTELPLHAGNLSLWAEGRAEEQSSVPPPNRLGRRMEACVQVRSGDEIEVELYLVEHPTAAGPIQMLFAHDITERKRSERTIRDLNESLRVLNAGLEARVAERTRALESANEELLAFSHSVSHDLKAPLRTIMTNTRLILEEDADRVSPDTLARLQRTSAGARKMGQLMDDLLKYARIGQIALSIERIDLSAMAQRIAADLKTSGATIDVDAGITVEGDVGMIEIVLNNLIGNAVKYVPPGDTPRVRVGLTGDGAVFVRDSGIGFDMRYIDKIWEPFERLHSDREYPGTGIGLANSKRIVQRHGGRMWAESAPGQGTTIYFTLGSPAVRESSAGPASSIEAR